MNDDEALDLYVKRVNELLSTRLVTSGDLRTSLSMRASVDQPMELSVHEPDEEALRSFPLTFRQFVSDRKGHASLRTSTPTYATTCTTGSSTPPLNPMRAATSPTGRRGRHDATDCHLEPAPKATPGERVAALARTHREPMT